MGSAPPPAHGGTHAARPQTARGRGRQIGSRLFGLRFDPGSLVATDHPSSLCAVWTPHRRPPSENVDPAISPDGSGKGHVSPPFSPGMGRGEAGPASDGVRGAFFVRAED